MPTYDYRCDVCGEITEVTKGYHDPDPEICQREVREGYHPSNRWCGGLLERVWTAMRFNLTGKGWASGDR